MRAVDRSRLGGGSKDNFLTGDWGGQRPSLSNRGIDFGFTYTTAAYRNVTGGIAPGGSVEGVADLNFDFDLEKLAGWPGARFHASSVAAHGTSISAHFVGDVNKISSYYLDRGLYLHEVWLEQTWLGGSLALRAGKISMDLEFPVYSYADSIPAPLYPTGGLGARLRYAPGRIWVFQTAIYDGDPNEPGRLVNRHGTHVRLGRHDGATALAEVAANLGYEPNSTILSGTWKLGTYLSTRRYADVGTGTLHRGDQAVYVNGDQTLWRENPKIKDDAQGLALYLVGEWAPADRNTYHYGYGGGPYYTGLLPGRNADVAYFNFLFTQFSAPYAAASRATGGPDYGTETRWQLNYQIVFTKFFSVTPEINYVVHPGGTGRLPNATVFGLRTNVAF
jgi:porin